MLAATKFADQFAFSPQVLDDVPMGSITAEALRNQAGEAVFARGLNYVTLVRDLDVYGSSARASVAGGSLYQCAIDWAEDLSGQCTCPHFEAGYFCKHVVALGLAALEKIEPDFNAVAQAMNSRAPIPAPAENNLLMDEVHSWLDSQDTVALRELVLELAAMSPEGRMLVETRASIHAGGG